MPDDLGNADESEMALRAEVARLRDIVGPSERSHIQLSIDILSARDAVMGAAAERGILQSVVRTLEGELTRALKEQQWFKAVVISRLKIYRALRRKVVGRARRAPVR